MFRKSPAVFFLFFSIYVCIVSFRLGLGSLQKPGAGFMPFLSGALVGILAVVLLIQDIISHRTAAAEVTKEKVTWKSIVITLAIFLVYILILEYLGYIIATILFVWAVLKWIEKKGWFLSSWVALAMALASYYIFKVWLQAELPRGFFGF